MNDTGPYTNQGMANRQGKPKRKLWLWGLGGCGLLACVGLGVLALFLFVLPGRSPSRWWGMSPFRPPCGRGRILTFP